MRAIEVEDEHAEARFVAAEIASLIANGYSASEIAVFYRMNAQSRVLEDVLVRQDVPYQVIGGPRFYERAEIRDATAYLAVLVNPQDATSLLRIANRPRRGIGDTSLQRLVAHAENTGRTLFQAMADPEAAGVTAAACRAVRGFHATMESLMALSADLPVDELLERVLEKSGTSTPSRPSARSRHAAGSRTSRSSSASRRSTDSRPRSRRSRRSCRRSRSSPTRTRSATNAASSR